jgi:hypothetical protein
MVMGLGQRSNGKANGKQWSTIGTRIQGRAVR